MTTQTDMTYMVNRLIALIADGDRPGARVEIKALREYLDEYPGVEPAQLADFGRYEINLFLINLDRLLQDSLELVRVKEGLVPVKERLALRAQTHNLNGDKS